ncbi:3-oxoadipate enol-lactonase [Rhodobacterales bacterium 52_120_T64]|nr:3-oxoadipate enol-lactonase [Rhodobacterales bacterium 52_120_T64]
MQLATINDIKVHYNVEGPEDGFPIVFSNSLGTDFRVWDALLMHLPQSLRFIRYDMRGHGLSEVPKAPYFMGDLVQDAAALMDFLGINNALFVGLSIGGVIAQGLAAERPDLVRAMVLSDTAAKIGTEQIWADRVDAVRKGGIAALAEPTLQRWFSKAFHTDKQDELAGWRHMLTRTPVEGYIGCSQAVAETDLYVSTSGLTLPTLALVGSEDGSTPPDMVRETAELIAGCKFKVIRKAGHLPCVEQPLEMATLITAFMKDNDLG